MKKIRLFAACLVLGLIAFSVSFAAVPTRITPEVTEISGAAKVAEPALEDEFSRLNSLESKYAENWEQQQRLRAATKRVANGGYVAPKKRR